MERNVKIAVSTADAIVNILDKEIGELQRIIDAVISTKNPQEGTANASEGVALGPLPDEAVQGLKMVAEGVLDAEVEATSEEPATEAKESEPLTITLPLNDWSTIRALEGYGRGLLMSWLEWDGSDEHRALLTDLTNKHIAQIEEAAAMN